MTAAAGEQSFESALAATLEDLELSFSLSKEQRTALKSFLKKGRCVRSFAGQIWQKLNLSLAPLLGKRSGWVKRCPIACRGNLKDSRLSRPSD